MQTSPSFLICRDSFINFAMPSTSPLVFSNLFSRLSHLLLTSCFSSMPLLSARSLNTKRRASFPENTNPSLCSDITFNSASFFLSLLPWLDNDIFSSSRNHDECLRCHHKCIRIQFANIRVGEVINYMHEANTGLMKQQLSAQRQKLLAVVFNFNCRQKPTMQHSNTHNGNWFSVGQLP